MLRAVESNSKKRRALLNPSLFLFLGLISSQKRKEVSTEGFLFEAIFDRKVSIARQKLKSKVSCIEKYSELLFNF